MCAAVSQSDPAPRSALERDQLSAVRAVGGVAISAQSSEHGTRLLTLHETGGYRLKCPARRDGVLEAVTINTGGGVAGGDRINMSATANERARLTMTTATAERIYRTHGPVTSVSVHLKADADATLAWLPQASILFSGASLQRRIEVDVTSSSRVVMAETTIFGRNASGETFSNVQLNDQWRIRRDGRLIFAEASRCPSLGAESLARHAIGGGAAMMAVLVAVAPNVEDCRDTAREALAATGLHGGVSAWNGILVARLLGNRLDRMAIAMRSLVSALDVLPLPTAWTH